MGSEKEKKKKNYTLHFTLVATEMRLFDFTEKY